MLWRVAVAGQGPAVSLWPGLWLQALISSANLGKESRPILLTDGRWRSSMGGDLLG